MAFYMEFGGETNKGIFSIVKRPSIPTPEPNFIETEVEGSNGLKYENLGTYKDIDIPVECNFVNWNPNTFAEQYRNIKKYLYKAVDNKLKFSDDPEYFYKVQKIKIDSFTRTLKLKGSFSIVFTCHPIHYSEEGQQPFDLIATPYVFNPYLISNPIYKLTGEGYVEFKVNGKLLKANVGTDLTIDTEERLCYRETGEMRNTAINQPYDYLLLKENDNEFEIINNPNNIKISIIPNWGDI